MARLRGMASQPDPAELRHRVEAELNRFAGRADAAGIPPEQRDRAHYTLCASLDDLVLTTPWGPCSAWADRSLTAAFHPAVGEGRFFDLLRQAESGTQFRPVLKLMFVCLSLGVRGSYRAAPNGAAEVEGIRSRVAAMVAEAQGNAVPALSAHWQGEDAAFTPGRARLPVWVAASAGLAVLAGLYFLLSLRLNDASDTLFARMVNTAPAHMPEVTRQPLATPPPPAPPPPEPSLADRLSARLTQAGLAGTVALAGSPTTPILRIPSHVLFAGTAAALLPGGTKLLDTLASMLKPEGDRIRISAFTDDRPLHTVLFPSAFQLSAAQARAVQLALARTGLAAGSAEGRASADPIAGNGTAEGRERNRRVEIVIEPADTP